MLTHQQFDDDTYQTVAQEAIEALAPVVELAIAEPGMLLLSCVCAKNPTLTRNIISIEQLENIVASGLLEQLANAGCALPEKLLPWLLYTSKQIAAASA